MATATMLLCAAIAGATPVSEADRTVAHQASSLQHAVVASSEHFAAEVIADYDTAKPADRHSYLGIHGIDILYVKYHAYDETIKRTGEYILQAYLKKNAEGQLKPDSVWTIKIYVPGKESPYFNYTYWASPADNGKLWEVHAEVGAQKRDYAGTFATKPTNLSDAEPLTPSTFAALSAQAQEMLSKARARASITYPAIPAPLQDSAPFPPATAAAVTPASEAERTMAHEASVLAALIRSDARAAGSSPTALVTHINGCCGIKVLVVSYLAKPGSYTKHGEYGLELVTFGGGGIEKVSVSTYKNRHAGFAKEYVESPYDFHMDPRGPKYTSPGDAWVMYNSPNFFHLHGADCSETMPAAVTELYAQALAIARQAPTRAPIKEESVLAPASCRITTP
jgi:hypothetical protein